VGYFVVHPGGQRYGPADLATLNQWAGEGRLIPDTTLVDEATGAQMFARDVPGLFFPVNLGAPGGFDPNAPTVMPGPTAGTPLGSYGSPYTPSGMQGSNYYRPTPLSSPGGGTAPAITASYTASLVGLGLLCCFQIGAFGTILAGIVAIALGASARGIDPGRSRGAIWLGIGVTVLGVLLLIGFSALGRAISG